jgi:hypothetical protein
MSLASHSRAEDAQAAVKRTESAGVLLEAGNGVCFASLFGLVPGIYDAGILAMMMARGTLATEYHAKFKEPPPRFGQSGEKAYAIGWLMKGAAIGGIVATAGTDNALLAFMAFPLLWLGGTVKHYEAQRLLFDDGMNRKSLILDPKESRHDGRDPPVRLALPYSF